MEPSFFNDKKIIYDDSLPSLENAPSVKEKVAKAEARFARMAAKQQAISKVELKDIATAAEKTVNPPPSFWITKGWKVVSVKSQADDKQFRATYPENGDIIILGGTRGSKKGQKEEHKHKKATQ